MRSLLVAPLSLDPPTLAATLLAHRCFMAGAVRVGLWPVRVAAWWEYAHARVGQAVPLAEFRPDPVWDDLMADVAEARRQTATPPVDATQPVGQAVPAELPVE